MTAESPLLQVDGVSTHFPIRSGLLRREVGLIRAVTDVSLTVSEGETLGIVGESGSGKTTLGRTIAQLERPTAGEILLRGRPISQVGGKVGKALRRDIQFVFQDPFASLNPRMTIGQIIEEPLDIFEVDDRPGRRRRARDLLELVGLPRAMADRYPSQLSGGQRQRIGIARALTLEPRILVLDEPVSALDVSVQAQVINLLVRLQDELGLSYLFIAHDLAVVKHISHRIAVMYLGRIVEVGETDQLLEHPQHPYTAALLAAVPRSDPRAAPTERIRLSGEPPSPAALGVGCSFAARCWKATAVCAEETPVLENDGGTDVACHHPLQDAVI